MPKHIDVGKSLQRWTNIEIFMCRKTLQGFYPGWALRTGIIPSFISTTICLILNMSLQVLSLKETRAKDWAWPLLPYRKKGTLIRPGSWHVVGIGVWPTGDEMVLCSRWGRSYFGGIGDLPQARMLQLSCLVRWGKGRQKEKLSQTLRVLI